MKGTPASLRFERWYSGGPSVFLPVLSKNNLVIEREGNVLNGVLSYTDLFNALAEFHDILIRPYA